ncbi:MAG: RsmE family RNA methyltransferase, partial [Verrucomicrobia bacterium]|nr:RsmE family RNA methyltransferase [Verrucomicrobiota bacterium]
MHRFYLPPEQCQEISLVLTDTEAHHARHVVRVRRGERVIVLDGAGHEFLCELQEYEGDKARLALVKQRFQPAPLCQLTLLQAVPKGKTMEMIIQKATELGAFRIVPVLSERVITQLNDQDAA